VHCSMPAAMVITPFPPMSRSFEEGSRVERPHICGAAPVACQAPGAPSTAAVTVASAAGPQPGVVQELAGESPGAPLKPAFWPAVGGATPTATTLSAPTPGWTTPRSSPTTRRTLRFGSGGGLARSWHLPHIGRETGVEGCGSSLGRIDRPHHKKPLTRGVGGRRIGVVRLCRGGCGGCHRGGELRGDGWRGGVQVACAHHGRGRVAECVRKAIRRRDRCFGMCSAPARARFRLWDIAVCGGST
jgi:hypothetical protein